MALPRTIEDREFQKFAEGTDGLTTVRFIADGRESTPNPVEFFNFFNPMAMPLLRYNRIIEWHEATMEFDRGIYFINGSFIQFMLRVNSVNTYDLEIIENNILLLDNDTALILDATNGEETFPISDIFLELE